MFKLVPRLQLTLTSQALLDYWQKIRGNDLVPLRASLRPADITKLLPSLMLLEYREPDQLVYRLAGTEIVRRIGVDFTGMNLFDTILPKQIAMTRRIFETVRSQPCGVVLHTKLKSKYGSEFISELVYMPLRDRQDNISQLVAVVDVVKRDRRPVTAAETKAAEQVKAIKGLEFFFLDIGAGLPEIEASTSGAAV